MSRFLSAEWLHDLEGAARNVSVETLPAGTSLVVEQVVSPCPAAAGAHDPAGGDGNPPGSLRWSMTLSCEGLRIGAQHPRRPDLTILMDASTAEAVARGTLNAQQALAAGSMRVRGDLTRVAAMHGALRALGDVFAQVRATTEFPG